MTTKIISEVYLECVEGTSNKFYSLALVRSGDGSYATAGREDADDAFSTVVNFGAIGAPRGWSFKVQGVDEAAARKAYDEVLKDKGRKYKTLDTIPAYALYPDADRSADPDDLAGVLKIKPEDDGWVSKLPAELVPLLRTAYFPQTEDREYGSGSGFGGTPYLPAGTEHPVCPDCQAPMACFAQLRLADLPGDAPSAGTGLLQMFYCVNGGCATEGDGWEPFSKGSVVRLIPDAFGAPSTEPPTFAPKAVTGWVGRPEIPQGQEIDEMGIAISDDLTDAFGEAGIPREGEKIGGWPYWVQNIEYPVCPKCGDRMSMVLQIDSEHLIDYMFGDVGIGHVTQCPSHPEVLAFGWACY